MSTTLRSHARLLSSDGHSLALSILRHLHTLRVVREQGITAESMMSDHKPIARTCTLPHLGYRRQTLPSPPSKGALCRSEI